MSDASAFPTLPALSALLGGNDAAATAFRGAPKPVTDKLLAAGAANEVARLSARVKRLDRAAKSLGEVFDSLAVDEPDYKKRAEFEREWTPILARMERLAEESAREMEAVRMRLPAKGKL